MLRKVILLLLYAMFFSAFCGALEYEVQFEGVSNPETLKLLKSASEMIKLEDRPPRTIGALKKRAESDKQNIIQVYHSQARYNVQVNLEIDDSEEPVQVIYNINEGPVYPLSQFDFEPFDDEDNYPYESLPLKELCIKLGSPATPKNILNAEEQYLIWMAKNGHPLAEVHNREVLVDQTSKKVSVILTVSSGPEATFGPLTITGNDTVNASYIKKRVVWCQGNRYDQDYIELTVNALEATGLFSSIMISHAPEISENGELEMKIELKEGAHHSFGLGLSYDTQWGPGAGFEWENRNFRGLGDKLSTSLFVWQKKFLGTALYVRPDFGAKGQDLLILSEYQKEQTKAYDEKSFSISGSIEKQLSANVRYSYGIMFKQLRNTKTDNDGDFNLVKFPFQFLWTATDDPLNPCTGAILQFKTIPTIQLLDHTFGYCITTLSASGYQAITGSCDNIFAGKFLIGSIMGSGRKAIPGSERFYAGSENTLRGYSFLTVSPLDAENDPIGGRSILVYSAELRKRTTENLGFVLFYDIGNVYEDYFPSFQGKLLQSTGVGLRYFTPVAPLRVDLAFPLNPRKGLDSNYQIYLSVGQAF